jgi:hypothetical protein
MCSYSILYGSLRLAASTEQVSSTYKTWQIELSKSAFGTVPPAEVNAPNALLCVPGCSHAVSPMESLQALSEVSLLGVWR